MEEDLKKVLFPLFKKRGVKEYLSNPSILLDYCHLALHFLYLIIHITNATEEGERIIYTMLIANTVFVLIKFRTARWHNIFLYINLLLFSFSPSFLSPLLLSSLEVLSFLLSSALLLIFPIPFLPPLSGPFGVGTRVGWMKVAQEDDLHLQFLHNHHIHLPDRISSQREMSVQIWYPVDKEEYKKGKKIKFWWPAAPHVFPHLLRIFKMPIFLVLHLLLGESNAVEGVKMSGKYEKYPLLISSHGFYGFKNDRSFLIEQLASWGFIIIGIDHIGDCSLAVSHSPSQPSIPFFSSLDKNDNEREIRHRGLIFRSSDLFYLLNFIHSSNLTAKFPTPFISPANQLHNENNKTMEMLKGRVDMEKVGCFGHSYGGATSIYMALANDDRIKCVVCFDPWAWPLFPSPSLLSPSSTSIPSIPPLHRSSNSLPSIIPPDGADVIKEEITKETLRPPSRRRSKPSSTNNNDNHNNNNKSNNITNSTSEPSVDIPVHRSIIPMLFINSEVWQSASLQKEIRQLIISNISAEGSLSVILKGSDHHNFDDLPFFGSHFVLQRLGNFVGPINPLTAYDVMSFLALKFIYFHFYNFDQLYENNLIDQCQNYIEIEKEYM